MITVDKQDAITLKLSQVMAASKKTELDFYLFVPGELGLGPEVIKESEIYFSSLHQKRTYFSDKTHLPSCTVASQNVALCLPLSIESV
ncbi:hypothetical protein JCM19233_7416 [Vibrio astriarenae]|nr:hypothetical protein JCM19233_7416 [Vibrio sp. C7]